MTIEEVKALKQMGNKIEIADHKLIPIVQYLLKGDNLFKSTQEVVRETNYSRYLIRNARDVIEIFLEENVK